MENETLNLIDKEKERERDSISSKTILRLGDREVFPRTRLLSKLSVIFFVYRESMTKKMDKETFVAF